jgi:ADP-dependent NAD(P)H-hydrate dehydratase / NAD(P)H-hydrate epimerase
VELLVTAREMQGYDRIAIERFGIPGIVLMENAGAGAVAAFEKRYGAVSGRSFTLFCGKGNNGGDGFVVARHLARLGAHVLVLVVGRKSDLRGDSRTNYRALAGVAKKLPSGAELRVKELASLRALKMLPRSEFAVDALFGTGFSGSVRGLPAKVIEWMNAGPGTNVSLDLPSGVDADNGEVGSVAVKADLTVTMGLKKIGLLTGEGRNCAGSVQVASIGASLEGIAAGRTRTFLPAAEDIRRVLPVRPFNAHKHSVGKILVLAGSRGLTGAAAMASASAMRSGAGAVVLGTPASVHPILARKLTEVMVEPLPETPEGTLSLGALERIEEHILWADVVILGPGLSRNEETKRLVLEVVAGSEKRLLIDADGLNAIAGKVSLLKGVKKGECIITPHTGELSRLTGMASEEIERNRVEVARRVAKQLGVTLVLKGAPTVTASRDGDLFVNSTGNPGMATAGSGDVLSGIIGALWAQGMSRTAAAFSGVFLHGMAGDLASREVGEKGLMAMDIHRHVPAAFLGVEGR